MAGDYVLSRRNRAREGSAHGGAQTRGFNAPSDRSLPGWRSQNPLVRSSPAEWWQEVHFPIPKHDQLMLRYLRKLLESGEFKPVIDRTYLLEQIVEAYRYVETGQ